MKDIPIEFKDLVGCAIHDFPYTLKGGRKCPHYALVSVTESGCCIFGCPMCYARAYPWSVNDKIVIFKNLPKKIDTELTQARIMPPMYISQVTDALQPLKEVREITYQVIRIILKHRVSFHIVTKSADGPLELIQQIPELIEYPYWYLSMTIEATPEKQEITSPFASPIRERLRTLKTLNELGIAVTARTDPFILGLMEKEDALWLVDEISETGVKHLVSSTGYYNKISMMRLIERLRESQWANRIPKVEKAYGFNEKSLQSYDENRRFQAPRQVKVEYHTWIKREAEKRGMTYAVCLELPQEFDSEGIPHCEGCPTNFVHIKDRTGLFQPVNCYGDCLRSCPDQSNPPCSTHKMASEFPYKLTTIGLKKSKEESKTLRLF